MRSAAIMLLSIAFLFAVISAFPENASSQSVDELRNRIAEQNERLKALEREIAQYEAELLKVGQEKETLQSKIRELDLSRQKLATDIRLTENRIHATGLQLESLDNEIDSKTASIERNKQVVANAIRRMNEVENESMFELMLTNESLSEVWDHVATLEQFDAVVRNETKVLTQLRADLKSARTEAALRQQELASFRSELSGQKSLLDSTRAQQNTLLRETENEESQYQRILAEKREAHEQFEQELNNLEAQLDTIINPGKLPSIGSGVLRWPFSDSYFARCPSYKNALGNEHCITQYFGNTPFATKNPQVYGGNGHNGVDFRSPVGTKIGAALSGIVRGTGNTDLQKGCYSYGKWVLVEHYNGLSTLYAHLSHISVAVGQEVSTGQTIGLGGNTGYSTGPHLHFTVYATEGVEIVRLGDVKRFTNCANVSIPIAPYDAYLNPLSYL